MPEIFTVSMLGSIAVKTKNKDTAFRIAYYALPWWNKDINIITREYLKSRFKSVPERDEKKVLTQQLRQQRQLRKEGKIKLIFEDFTLIRGKDSKDAKQKIRRMIKNQLSQENAKHIQLLSLRLVATPRREQMPFIFETEHLMFDAASKNSPAAYSIIDKEELDIIGCIVYNPDGDLELALDQTAPVLGSTAFVHLSPEKLKDIYSFVKKLPKKHS